MIKAFGATSQHSMKRVSIEFGCMNFMQFQMLYTIEKKTNTLFKRGKSQAIHVLYKN